MPKSKIPSPARSHGAVTPRRYKSRGPRSVGSPARSNVSGRLTSVLNMHKNSFVLSPMPTRRSVLADNTDIEEPKRRSWWRQLGENSRDVMEVIESNKVGAETDNVEELIEMEVLSQEKKDYHLDLPESSGSESIHSIVMPQRKLFKHKENDAPKMFGQIVGNRETLPKLHKSSSGHDKSIKVGPRELFQSNKQRTKPIFPAALLDISLNKTVADKTKENLMEPPKNQVRNIFGNRAPTKRRNMFAEFVVSESEDEIPEIQPKVFGFPKKSDPKRRGSSTSRGMREPSPASSITTDMEMDEWKQLPSSTMVAEQLEEAMSGTPVKRARLSKLSEAKESDTGTNSNATVDKTKQSNKSISSKNKSKNSSTIKDKSLEMNTSMTTRNAARNMQNNILVDNIALETSFTSKNMAYKKSRNSSSSLNKRNSKQTEHSLSSTNNKSQISEKSKQNISKTKKTLHTEGSQQTKQDNKLTNLDEQDENNADIYENEENNFTLEYESDERQETVEQNVENLSAKNKTVTLRKDSNKAHNDITSPEKPKQNTSVKELQSTSKKMINATEESAMLKENEVTSIDMNTNGAKNISVNVAASKDVSDGCKANIDNYTNVVENNDMEFDEQDNNYLESESVHEQMDVDDINEGKEESKDTVSESIKGSTNVEVSNKNLSNYHKSAKMLESQKVDQTNVENKQVSKNEELLNENDNQKEGEGNDAKHSRETSHSANDGNKRQEVRIEESIENSEDLRNKSLHSKKVQDLNISNQKEEDNSNKDIRKQNESEIIKHNEMDVEDENENEAAKQNESNAEELNGNEMLEHDESKPQESNESEIVEQNSTAEKHNESEMEEQNKSKAEEQNDSKVVEQDKSDVEEQNNSEVEENDENQEDMQNESGVLEHDISEKEQENETEVEEEDANEGDEQNESKAEEQEETVAHDQDADDAEEQIESEAEEQEATVAHNQDADDAEEQIESEVEEQNESEAEEQNESGAEEQNESELEEHYESEAEEHNESEAEEENESEEESQNQSQEASEDVIERTETPNSSGMKSPEAVLHDQTNRGGSITAKGRNTSVRKSKSMIQPLNIRPSLAPPRDSIEFSDGTKNSTAEGSGWDSHRTTRKTLRHTFGRDFSPRKSLRALVMEKSAKRQTAYMDGRPHITSLPQANSTEFPEMSNRDYEETVESDHELSRRTRQATLEMCLEQIKTKNLERWERVGEQVRNMFKTSNKENVRFKEPRPMFESIRKTKQVKTKPKDKQLGSLMPLDYLPSEILEDMKYKPPKRFQPRNVSWITKRLYKFLETKLEPKYDYKARVRAEKLVESMYDFAKSLKRHQVAPTDAVDVLKHEMARLDIVKTHFEFYEFIKNYMPREIRIKVIPDIVNKIPMPSHGIFSEILIH